MRSQPLACFSAMLNVCRIPMYSVSCSNSSEFKCGPLSELITSVCRNSKAFKHGRILNYNLTKAIIGFVLYGRCPKHLKHSCIGKEEVPTIAFQCVV